MWLCESFVRLQSFDVELMRGGDFGMRVISRMGVAGLSVVMMALVMASSALATATYDLSGASNGFVDQIKGALTVALPIGAAIVALMVGWKLWKRFAHG
jgi:hypothetical protein